MAFGALLAKFEPNAIDLASLDAGDAVKNATEVCKALDKLSVKRIFEPNDLALNPTINMVADQLVEYVRKKPEREF